MNEPNDFRTDAVAESRRLLAASVSPDNPLRAGISLCLPREDDLTENGARRLRWKTRTAPIQYIAFCILGSILLYILWMLTFRYWGLFTFQIVFFGGIVIGCILLWRWRRHLLLWGMHRGMLVRSLRNMDSDWVARHRAGEALAIIVSEFGRIGGARETCTACLEPELNRIVLIGHSHLYILNGEDVVWIERPRQGFFQNWSLLDLQFRIGERDLAVRLSLSLPYTNRRVYWMRGVIRDELLISLGKTGGLEKRTLSNLYLFWK